MIKKTFTFFTFLLLIFSASAQEQVLKMGIGRGLLPYEGQFGRNVEIQYERSFSPRLSGYVGVGMNSRKFTYEISSRGTSGGESWDNTYSYNTSERFYYLDLGCKQQLIRFSERSIFKTITGLSIGQSAYQYPRYLETYRGNIVEYIQEDHQATVLMAHLGIEQEIRVLEDFWIILHLSDRTTFGERQDVIQTTSSVDPLTQGTLTTSISHVPQFSIQFGFAF